MIFGQPCLYDTLEGMKRKNKGFSAILVLILVLLVAAAGGVFYLNSKKESTGVPSPSPTQTLSPTPTSKPSTSWKTYTNSELGISISYPPKWTISKVEKVEGVSTFWLTSDSPSKTYTGGNLQIVIGSALVYSTSGALFGNALSCEGEGQFTDKPFSVEIEGEVYTTQINGKSCIKTGDDLKLEHYRFQFYEEGKLPYVTGTYFTMEEREEIVSMLSTIKFLD